MGKFGLKQIFLPTEHVKKTGEVLGLREKKEKQAPPPPEPAKSDTSEVASLKAEIAQLKEMIMQLKAPSVAVSSTAYNINAQRAAMGMSPGVSEPAYRFSRV